MRDTSAETPLDLLIVGAGLSGIDLVHHVNENFPDWDWAIVDSNKAVGGTWVTFTYPGIGSDSDMATFSFPFKRWPHEGSLGSGANIQRYVEDVAREEGVFERLSLHTWVKAANFHTDLGLWEVTLLPALHSQSVEVTMLQRTPTYIAPLLNRDNFTAANTRLMPEKQALATARKLHIFRDMMQYWMCQGFPWLARAYFMALNRWYIPFSEIFKNFNPPYGPWDQRVCKSPDGDFFKAMQGGAKVVTGRIDTVTPEGISLIDGTFLPADFIITATGLDIQVFGGARISVDGVEHPVPQSVAYRGLMVDGLPNFSFTVGYLNQSWTLRAGMVTRYMVRLWTMMERDGYTRATPKFPTDLEADLPLMNMDSGYLVRARKDLPTQAKTDPWHFAQDYIREYRSWGRPSADLREDMVFA